jgi:hypothetical protein
VISPVLDTYLEERWFSPARPAAKFALICADASDFLLPSESADGFHDVDENTQKPSHEEQVKNGACETANEQQCDDSPSSEHGFLAAHLAVFRLGTFPC